MDADKVEKCPCKRSKCPRYGDCEACREHHVTVKGSLPACERPVKAEKRKNKK